MNQPVCAQQFLETAIQEYQTAPNDTLLEVRRFVNQHDVAEFSSVQQVVVQCHLGGCAVTLSSEGGSLSVSQSDSCRAR